MAKQNYQHGGWYDNPATGQNQRFWNGQFLPVGQVEPGVYLQGVGQSQQQAQESYNNSYSDPVLDLIQTTIDEYSKKAEEYTRKYNEFEKNNPFVFDKILGEERTKVAQRLDPYYTQTLGDYLTGVNTQIQRGTEDERRILTELNQDTETYQGNAKLQLTDAIERSREGAADAGLYSSGAALREQGKIEQASGQDMATYLTNAQRKADEVKRTQERNAKDLQLQSQQKQRDLKQEQYYQTESQAQTAVGQRQNQRTFEQGQFTGAPPGVDPTQFSQTLYNYLGR